MTPGCKIVTRWCSDRMGATQLKRGPAINPPDLFFQIFTILTTKVTDFSKMTIIHWASLK
jgi:hypothetical protein